MKLPRDLSGASLSKALSVLGYEVARQKGSYLTLTTQRNGDHHVTIPLHDPLKTGTLNGILKDIADHHHMDRQPLLQLLFS